MNEENGERIGRDPAHSLFLFSLPFTSFSRSYAVFIRILSLTADK